MINLSALGLSNVNTAHSGGKRDKAGASHEHGKSGKSFGDLVDDAGKKTNKKVDADDASTEKQHGGKVAVGALSAAKSAVAAAATDDVKTARVDALDIDDSIEAELPKPEAGAENATSNNRVQLSSGFQQMMKTAAEGGVLRRADVSQTDANAGKEATGTKTENKKSQVASKDEQTEVKGKSKPSPSEELHALLGMTSDSDDADDVDAVDKTDDKRDAKAANRAAENEKADAGSIKGEQVTESTKAESKADAGKTEHASEPVKAERIPDVVKTDAAPQQVAAQQIAAPALPAQQSTSTRGSTDTSARDDADAKAPAAVETDKIRLVSADGKTSAVDIELAKVKGDDGAEQAVSGKVDFVTVLDSRRYLGFSNDAVSGNANALAGAIKADPSWAQVIHAVNTGANQTATEVNTLKLQMNPEHLGNMTASLRLKGDELSVEVRVETVDAYRQLSNDQDGIVKALKDQGFAIDQVSIQLSPSAKADGGQSSTSQNNGSQNGSQSGNGQNLQEGGQGDNARQRDESARRNANQNNWTGNDRTSSFSDSGNGSDDRDSGNLYL